MFPTFRLSMTWLHTWFGLVLGFVLMVVFFFGSLSVFDREIDRWAIPADALRAAAHAVVRHACCAPVFEQHRSPDADELDAARERVDGAAARDACR